MKLLTFVAAPGVVLQQAGLWAFTEAKNMNEGVYDVANARGGGSGYSTEYDTEYFDVYSPVIKSFYSQVFWADMDPVPLPQHIIDRFTNKTMAIVGYEVDQVQKVGNGEDGEDGEDGGDIPVPITHAYNHHYMAYLSDNRQGQMVRKEIPKEFKQGTLMTHGMETMLDFEYFNRNNDVTMVGGDDDGCSHEKNPSQFVPHSQIFSEGNGGEMVRRFPDV
jgi:hypothetical protein